MDQILRDGARRGRDGAHAAIERILRLEPGLQRADLWRRIRHLKSLVLTPKYRRSVWTLEDEEILRQGYAGGWKEKREAIRELQRRHPEWRPHVIWRRAAKVGLVHKGTKRRPERHRQRWSEEDDRVLLSLAGYKRLRMIAKLLHRSERSVRYRLAMLGKSSRVHFDGYARRSLAEQLHFGRRTIEKLIVTGLLEVHDPRITPESIHALRRSGRLTGLSLHHGDGNATAQPMVQQQTTVARDVEKRSAYTSDSSVASAKTSRARRVWADVAGALNLSLGTVEQLIAERTLKMYDPRVTERSFMNFCRRHGSSINWEFLDGETRAWLQGSMDLNRSAGKDSAGKLHLFRKHALIVRKCDRCARTIRGNAFFRHVKNCKSSNSSSNETGPLPNRLD